MDAASDDFYRQHMYNNYGEVGLSVKDMVDKFAAASAQHKQVRAVHSRLVSHSCMLQDRLNTP